MGRDCAGSDSHPQPTGDSEHEGTRDPAVLGRVVDVIAERDEPVGHHGHAVELLSGGGDDHRARLSDA